jgi:hypothetical protein
MAPFTTATALQHGWVWETPLYSRLGSGYVFSSAHVSDQQADRELRLHFGLSDDLELPTRRLRMRIGRSEACWNGNCIAVGLAAGFLEPLESTGIFLTELGLSYLDACFPDKAFEPGLIKAYNREMQRAFDAIRDFIVLHYKTNSRRRGAFWEDVRNLAAPETVDELIELWDAVELDGRSAIPAIEFFRRSNFGQYLAPGIFCGVGRVPGRHRGTAPLRQPLACPGATALDLPDHQQYLDDLHTKRSARFQAGSSTR